MLKKTTVYLTDDDLALLRKRATIPHVTVAEAIRQSIQETCRPKNKEKQDLWDSIDKLWAKTGALSPARIDSAVDKAVKEVRRGRKARRRP